MRRLALLAPDELDDRTLGALALQAHLVRDRLWVHRYRFEPARLQRIDRALRDLFEPGLTAGTVVQVLELLAVDHDFLRLGSKRSIPPPVTILTPASRSAAAP
mmetsp:Transcript_34123/g.104845  ORF Transcript_34123/g.104845 Transcript_34123/m.104845 type:complete len:103 (-) Transcript_34123:114-422(-)